MSTLPHTGGAVFLCDCLEGSFDFFVCVEAYLVYKVMKSLAIETRLHL